MIRAVAALTRRRRRRAPGENQRRRPGARVDAADRAEPPLAQHIGRMVEIVDDLAFPVEPPVVEDQNHFGIGENRLRIVHDDDAEKPAPELFAGKGLDQRLIENVPASGGEKRRSRLSPGAKIFCTRPAAPSISLAIPMPRNAGRG